MAGVQGDRELPEDGFDQLGFRPTAEHLAEALSTARSIDGLVIGVVGRWGSGKSSLLNLTRAALRHMTGPTRPYVVEFKPWLVGDRDALLRALFAELIAGIDQIELEGGDASGATVRTAQRAGDALRDFATNLEGVGKLVNAAGYWWPPLGLFGRFLEKVGNTAKKKGKVPSLAASKSKVVTKLRELERPLIVLIDDIDRLDPNEITEVLRLVRSVADFPNITYVLSYDLDIVAHAVRVAARVRDGRAYIEKIVQIIVHVPFPEAFDLRRWFERELWKMNLERDAQEERRIAEIIDQEGGRYLTTPRAVVRTLDSVRFYWAALEGQVDFSDFVWLQFVKVGNAPLFDWIAVYLTEISARATGRVHIPAEQATRLRAELDKALESEGATLGDVRERLSNFLPGMSGIDSGGDGPGIFQGVSAEETNRAIRDSRLSSPDHYRLYFALAPAANALRREDYDTLRSALGASDGQILELLREWQRARSTSGVSKAELLLDRLPHELQILDAEATERLLLAFADVMDELAAGSFSEFGGPDIWRRAKNALPSLLHLVREERMNIIRRMFAEGRALGFLTSIFRDETFAHGRFGDRPQSERIFTSDELDLVVAAMSARYRAMTFQEISQLPEPLSALYAWQQGGDEDGPIHLLESEMESADGLVYVLETLGTTIRTAASNSNNTFTSLSRRNLEHLIDVDLARSRIDDLASNNTESADLVARARRLRDAFETGRQF